MGRQVGFSATILTDPLLLLTQAKI